MTYKRKKEKEERDRIAEIERLNQIRINKQLRIHLADYNLMTERENNISKHKQSFERAFPIPPPLIQMGPSLHDLLKETEKKKNEKTMAKDKRNIETVYIEDFQEVKIEHFELADEQNEFFLGTTNSCSDSDDPGFEHENLDQLEEQGKQEPTTQQEKEKEEQEQGSKEIKVEIEIFDYDQINFPSADEKEKKTERENATEKDVEEPMEHFNKDRWWIENDESEFSNTRDESKMESEYLVIDLTQQ